MVSFCGGYKLAPQFEVYLEVETPELDQAVLMVEPEDTQSNA